MYDAKVLADSISAVGQRITTFEVTIPRIVLAEFNTHRMLSRNSASSRAIPVAKAIEAVEKDPFIPETFHKNQKGMQAEFSLEEDQATLAQHYWQGAIDAALEYASGLERIEVHKGLANRILEPFKWHTVITTGTDWENFFALRTDKNAQEEIRRPALMMRELYEGSEPEWITGTTDWHVPLVDERELLDQDVVDWEYWKLVSVGRCARVSYLTHHGVRDPDADVELAKRLMTNGHLSPFEHVARPFNESEWSIVQGLKEYLNRASGISPFANYLSEKIEYQGNLRGWHSARMDIPNQDNYAEAIRLARPQVK